MTIARCWAVSYGWRGPAAHGGRCPRSTASSPPPTGDGGHGRSGVCGSASFRRWDGKRYPDRRPNSASDAVGTVYETPSPFQDAWVFSHLYPPPLQVVVGLIVAMNPEAYLRTTRVCAAMSPRRCRLAEAITAMKPTRSEERR